MKPIRFLSFCAVLLSTLHYLPASGQDTRTQLPTFLSKSYFGIDIGYINYPFSNQQLIDGYVTERIEVPHVAVRITLLGYRFNKFLSAEINYLRPVSWVRYKDINGAPWNLPVSMNIGTIVLKPEIPLSNKFSVKGELGLALITRGGMDIDQTKVMEDAAYGSISIGGGLTYHLNQKWDIAVNASYSPSNKKVKQPSTSFYSAGFKYNMHPLPNEVVKRNSESGYIFPHNLIQVGYSMNEFGYGVNDFFSKGAVPIFWGGKAEVRKGFSLHYQRNIFHTRKVFSLDWGSSLAYWKSNEVGDQFFTISLYPVLRFTILRTKPVDFYFNYSVAGPTYISRVVIDSMETGKRFTFQDFMGMGIYAGRNRKFNAEVRIAHYSNGNLFPHNDGIKIPLSFIAGIAF